MTRCEADHSVFYQHSSVGCVYLIVYVDDIVLTRSKNNGISQLKQHLCHHFQTKDFGKLKYFLGIKVAQFNDGIVISQRKYVMDTLEETGLMSSNLLIHPWVPILNFYQIRGSLYLILSSIEDWLGIELSYHYSS